MGEVLIIVPIVKKKRIEEKLFFFDNIFKCFMIN